MTVTPAGAALALGDISKRYGGTQALLHVSLTVPPGRVVGLVGENGAGKSTLISVINGTVVPDTGAIWINGARARFGHPDEAARGGVATVFQEQGLIPTIPVFENIFLGREHVFLTAGFLRRGRLIAEAAAVLQELEIDIDPLAATGALSFGQRQLVEIAKAFALNRIYPVRPVILLDEPTSALSDQEAGKLFDGIARWRSKASFLFVSHRLADVLSVCDEVVAMKDGKVVGQMPVGGTSENALHELIVGRQRDTSYYKEDRQSPPRDGIVLTASRLVKSGVLHGVSLAVREGEILGVAGVLGSGKSTLARILAGAEQADSGTVEIAGAVLFPLTRRVAIRHGIGYVPAERSLGGIIGTHSLEWNVSLPNLAALERGPFRLLSPAACNALAQHWIGRLRIRAAGATVPCGALSGGNQQKVVFAKWLARNVRVLVLDDPGRGLDVGAKEQIYGLLRELCEAGAAILLVSDNLPELIGLSHRIIVLRDGHLSAHVAAPPQAKPREADIVRAMV
jgi:ribose transport system ATP-binding protein